MHFVNSLSLFLILFHFLALRVSSSEAEEQYGGGKFQAIGIDVSPNMVYVYCLHSTGWPLTDSKASSICTK